MAVGLAAVAVLAMAASSLRAQDARNPSSSAAFAKPSQPSGQGRELFSQHCASCHFADSTAQKIGPGLKGLYGRAFANGRKVDDAGLSRWIEAGGKDMPGFRDKLKAAEIRELILYIKKL